jgi:tetratricopeptide (TPR) repeat protein
MTTRGDSQDNHDRHQVFDSAQRNFSAGNLGEAATICLQILDDTPTDSKTLFLLALIRFQEGNFRESVELLRGAVHEDPDSAIAHERLGAALVILGRSEEAVESLQRALELKPDSSTAHSNLGNAFHSQGILEEAEKNYRTAINYDPKNVQAHVSLGNLMCQLREPSEAVECFSEALTVEPSSALIYQFLGNAYRQLGQLDDALASYRKSLDLDSTHSGARFELGLTLKNLGQLEEAIQHFEIANTERSRPFILECLLKLERHDEFFTTLEAQKGIDRANLRTAAISAYASQQLGRGDPHPFCPDPIGHIRVVDDLVGADGTDEFLSEILDEVKARPALYNPRGVTTYNGYQTGGNLFASPTKALAKLDQIFKDQIEKYYQSIESEQSVFVQERPKDLKLRGWYVRYLESGYQGGHIHPTGWVTCVIYLSMPKNVSNPSEGGIKFTLKNDDYPEILTDVPSLFHVPVNGQIVLFPSSLYHYTIPVTSGEERLMIASDLLPG